MAHNLIHDIAGIVKARLDSAYDDMRSDARSSVTSSKDLLDGFSSSKAPAVSAFKDLVDARVDMVHQIEAYDLERMNTFFNITLPNSEDAADGLTSLKELLNQKDVWSGSFVTSHSMAVIKTDQNLSDLNSLYGSEADFRGQITPGYDGDNINDIS